MWWNFQLPSFKFLPVLVFLRSYFFSWCCLSLINSIYTAFGCGLFCCLKCGLKELDFYFWNLILSSLDTYKKLRQLLPLICAHYPYLTQLIRAFHFLETARFISFTYNTPSIRCVIESISTISEKPELSNSSGSSH